MTENTEVTLDSLRELLTKIVSVEPSAFIAGGALRDLTLNKPIKDVDVFIPVQEDEHFAEELLDRVAVVAKELGMNYITHCQSEYLDDGLEENRDVILVASIGIQQPTTDMFDEVEFETVGLGIDLIFVESKSDTIDSFDEMTEQLKAFDIGLCQIGMYKTGTVFHTTQFETDVINRTITVYNINRSDRQTKRVNRMKDKFPTYEVEYAI